MKLSKTMQEAVDFARAQGGSRLMRYPGGFWAGVTTPMKITVQFPDGIPEKHVGTQTIRALVARGVASYSGHRNDRHGKPFPIEVTVK